MLKKHRKLLFWIIVVISVLFFAAVFYFLGFLEWLGSSSRIGVISAVISSLATALIAGYTIILAKATNALTSLAEQQENTAKTHERAYIFCGGLFGDFKLGNHPKNSDLRHDACNYDPPWMIMIHNFGRTPGFITKIEYGVVLEAEFPVDRSVSKIIKDKKFKDRIKTVEIRDVFAPTGTDPIRYRYVRLEERKEGEVFFGKISYEDVFHFPHHSTFAILHKKHNSDTIGKSYADDWS